MNSIAEDIMDLLQGKSNLPLPYKSVYKFHNNIFFGGI